jgi:hypothetical protein
VDESLLIDGGRAEGADVIDLGVCYVWANIGLFGNDRSTLPCHLWALAIYLVL